MNKEIDSIKAELLEKYRPKSVCVWNISKESYPEQLILAPVVLGAWAAGFPAIDKLSRSSNQTLAVALIGLTYMFASGDSILMAYRAAKAGVKNMINKKAVEKGVNAFMWSEHHIQ